VIRTSRSEGVAEITFDRAEKRNALTPAMLEGLIGAVADLEADEAVRAILLRGEGGAFCAGFDLKMCAEEGGALGALLRGLSHAVRAMRRCEKPVVICAHGAAIAGGCALLGGSDVVVTERGAKLGYPVVSIGISPAVSAPTLAGAIGHGPARERSLEPRVFSGEEAFGLGLAHACEDDAGACLERARAVARTAASRPIGAMRATKRWLNETDGTNDDETFERALRASTEILGNKDERHALQSIWGAKTG